MFICVYLCWYVHMSTGAHRDQEVFSDTVDLESIGSSWTESWEPKSNPLPKQYKLLTTELPEASVIKF